MEKYFALVTIFALLFAVSTARISLHSDFPVIQNCNDIKSQPVPQQPQQPVEESNSDIVLPNMESQATDQNLKVDLTPRSDYARFHAINRHFFDESLTPLRPVHRRPFRHFQNPFMIPRSEISDDIHAFETEKLHRGTPFKRLKSRHDYSTHRHHRHQHHRLHRDNHNSNVDVSIAKRKVEHEKTKSFVHQHNEKKRERENKGNLVTSIRKFLKHSFE